MIAALLIDLGDTLAQGEHVLPHAPEALACLASVPLEQGGTLPLALVSDFDDPFSEYVAFVDELGLLRYFDPPERHVTLSALAGVRKPARKIFELAMTRLGLPADLAHAAFITENAAHVSACRALGMKALQLGVDFQDWAEVPLRVLAWVTPPMTAVAGALDLYLESRYGFGTSALSGEPAKHGERVLRGFVAGDPANTEVVVRIDTSGVVRSVQVGGEALGTPEEAARFLAALKANRQVVPAGEPLPPGATHEVSTGPDGKPRVTRKRFSLR